MEFISEDIVSLRPIYKKIIFLERFDEVWINGKNTHHFIEEHCLNACVKIGSLYILFTSENIPWPDHSPWCENSSWRDVVTYYGLFKATIYLFNDEGEMLDQTYIKSTNFSENTASNSDDYDDEGSLGSHLISFELAPPDTVTFNFGESWTLKLLKEPVPFTEELYRRGLGLLNKPRRHGVIKRLFCFLTKRPLGSQPKNLHKTYFDLSVKIVKKSSPYLCHYTADNGEFLNSSRFYQYHPYMDVRLLAR